MSTEFYWVSVVSVTIVSASRLTRLLVFDKFPPIKWVRDKYEDKTDGTGWQWLALCGYCMSPWVTLVVVVTGLLAGVYSADVPGWGTVGNEPFLAWWMFNGIFAVSYLAAILMAHDGDTSEDDS